MVLPIWSQGRDETMTPAELRTAATADQPPAGLSPPLVALWQACKGDWDSAHQTVQSEETREACWVHAHLHRIEGDLKNAAYWYRRAGMPAAEGSLAAEWDAIAAALLAEPTS